MINTKYELVNAATGPDTMYIKQASTKLRFRPNLFNREGKDILMFKPECSKHKL